MECIATRRGAGPSNAEQRPRLNSFSRVIRESHGHKWWSACPRRCAPPARFSGQRTLAASAPAAAQGSQPPLWRCRQRPRRARRLAAGAGVELPPSRPLRRSGPPRFAQVVSRSSGVAMAISKPSNAMPFLTAPPCQSSKLPGAEVRRGPAPAATRRRWRGRGGGGGTWRVPPGLRLPPNTPASRTRAHRPRVAPSQTGFDPLYLSEFIDIKWAREAELKHGRICMLCALPPSRGRRGS